mmetsp:Transcript_4836/g.10042  ORF Transcript_4836/g.10042 Transcript_4836/m.10042 type:complete len:80 (+) Transcript_4836:444-683(+)
MRINGGGGDDEGDDGGGRRQHGFAPSWCRSDPSKQNQCLLLHSASLQFLGASGLCVCLRIQARVMQVGMVSQEQLLRCR